MDFLETQSKNSRNLNKIFLQMSHHLTTTKETLHVMKSFQFYTRFCQLQGVYQPQYYWTYLYQKGPVSLRVYLGIKCSNLCEITRDLGAFHGSSKWHVPFHPILANFWSILSAKNTVFTLFALPCPFLSIAYYFSSACMKTYMRKDFWSHETSTAKWPYILKNKFEISTSAYTFSSKLSS